MGDAEWVQVEITDSDGDRTVRRVKNYDDDGGESALISAVGEALYAHYPFNLHSSIAEMIRNDAGTLEREMRDAFISEGAIKALIDAAEGIAEEWRLRAEQFRKEAGI